MEVVETTSRNQTAFALLVAGKVFGIAGLVLGSTNYRFLGGALLVMDGLLLCLAGVVALKNMKKQAVEEKTHKQLLEQMLREGTLNQYLRDIRANQSRTSRA